jgi:prepilin-type N-terminal cleavage/methylation domain-containing protein
MKIRLKREWSSAGRFSPACARLQQTGFTFTEVLVATAILGFVATSLYAAFAAGFCVIQSTRENLRATQILVQKMEAIRLLTWSQVNDTNRYLKPTFTADYDPLGTTNHAGGAKYAGYVSTSTPTDLPDGYRANMLTVTVGVSWTNYNGGKPIVHRREMQTRVARNGMQNYIWGAL